MATAGLTEAVTSINQVLAPLNQGLEDLWGRVVDATGGEEEEYFRLCLLPLVCALTLFWVLNIPLLFWNFFPAWNPLERFKVQKNRYEKFANVKWMVALVLFNQGLSLLIAASPQNFQGLKQQGILTGRQGVPTVLDLLWMIPVCCELYDTLFFIAHCTFHTKWLYHNIHKVHHRSKITIGISSAYFHPVDYFVSGISVVLPPLIVSNHVIVAVIWMLVHMCETTNAHCGYDIPLFPSAKDHDFHHSHSFYSSKKYRFVTMGAFLLVWDRLFGTRKPCWDWWAEHPQGLVRSKDIPVEKETTDETKDKGKKLE